VENLSKINVTLQKIYTTKETTASIKSIASIKNHEKPQRPLSVAERLSPPPTSPVSGDHCYNWILSKIPLPVVWLAIPSRAKFPLCMERCLDRCWLGLWALARTIMPSAADNQRS